MPSWAVRTATASFAIAVIPSFLLCVALSALLLIVDPLAALSGLLIVFAFIGGEYFYRRRNWERFHRDIHRPDDGGDAAIAALVGAGPRGPRSASDAKSWPEV